MFFFGKSLTRLPRSRNQFLQAASASRLDWRARTLGWRRWSRWTRSTPGRSWSSPCRISDSCMKRTGKDTSQPLPRRQGRCWEHKARDGRRRSPLSPRPPCSASLARRGTRQSLDLYSHNSVKFILKERVCWLTIPTKECSGVGAPSHGQPPAKRPEGKSTEAISGKVLHHPVHLARNGFHSSFFISIQRLYF